MGTEVQLERYMPGYRSARELGENASSAAWNYYDRKCQRTAVDLHSECDKDGLKQKMLEHDAIFRKQVSELHRLYRTQRDLMDEMKRSEPLNHHMPWVYKRQDSSKMHAQIFPSSNSACTSPSILGTEHSSPNLSHLKRKSPKTDLLCPKDVDDSMDCEIIECRPGKVRRKMFDLELLADEYIHPISLDQSIDEKARSRSFHIHSGFHDNQSLFGGRSMSTSKGNGMKDLNEPIQIEDDTPTLDLLNSRKLRNNVETDSLSLQTPPKYYSSGTSAISCYNGNYMDSRRALLVGGKSSTAQSSHQLSLGKFKAKDSSLSQYLRPENSPEPSRHIYGRNGTLYGTSFPDNSKEGFLNDGIVGYEPVSRAQFYGLNCSSDVNCWSRPMPSWENYGCNSTQKQPYFISSVGLSKSSQVSNQPSKFFDDKLNINSGYAIGIPRRDLDHGSSSASKEDSIRYPSMKFERLGGCKEGLKYSNGSNGLSSFDLNSSEGTNLNAAAASDSLCEIDLHQNLVAANQTEQSGKALLLPWLKPKPFSSEIARANLSQTSNQFLHESESGKKNSCNDHKKSNGFLEFAQPLTVGSFRSSKGYKSEMNQKRQVFDMNLPGDTEAKTDNLSADEIADTKITGFKNLFDLNSCLTEDEPSEHSASSSVARNVRGIDLEAPAPLDIDEDITFRVSQEAEFEHVAAQAMLSFSSLKKSYTMERACAATGTLKWFVGVISSHSSNSKQQASKGPQSDEISLHRDEEPLARTSSDEIDYFESMTIKLTEMSAEESMPKSAFPPIPNVEEEELPAALLATRPRRGQARRGRPKRDFQRDILPGIASLSRHEVTEDFQAFDGLMRASGHAWQFGKRAASRNKPRRGRPRTVNADPIPSYSLPKQPTTSCARTGMDESNLTGWGKTTRRPRRQRCPGNLQPIRLS